MAVERTCWIKGPGYWITTWPGGYCRAELSNFVWLYSLHNKAGFPVWQGKAKTRREVEAALLGRINPGNGFSEALASVQIKPKPKRKGASPSSNPQGS